MLINKNFIYINHTLNGVDPRVLWFSVPEDKRLHLGDRLFLNKICGELNDGKTRDSKSIIFWVTLAKRLDAVVGPVIGLNFSCPIWLSPVERIRFELKKRNLYQGECFDIGGRKKILIYCPEYASSRLRLIGLERRLQFVLDIFRGEGFQITYLGENKNSGNCFDKFITGIAEGHEYIRDSNSYAFLGVDNYWMHISADYGLRRYILQRRKFLSQNLINHVGVLNEIMSKNSQATYI